MRAQVQEGGDAPHLVGCVLRTPPSGAHLVSGAITSRGRVTYYGSTYLPRLHLLWQHACLPSDAGRGGEEADDHNVPYARRHPAWLGLGLGVGARVAVGIGIGVRVRVRVGQQAWHASPSRLRSVVPGLGLRLRLGGGMSGVHEAA